MNSTNGVSFPFLVAVTGRNMICVPSGLRFQTFSIKSGRIPQESYEAWLPLTATPAPEKTVRVGFVFHAHLEPELDEHVEQLIKQLGVEDYENRIQAQAALLRIGGAAF